jgi:hypothetical protein
MKPQSWADCMSWKTIILELAYALRAVSRELNTLNWQQRMPKNSGEGKSTENNG